MKPTFPRHSRSVKANPPPLFINYIENPHVVQVQVCHALPAMHDQIRVAKLTGMVSAFPRGFSGLLRHVLGPYFGLPVEDADTIVTSSIMGSPAIEDDLI